MYPVLTEIFLLRATNERLGWKMSWIPFAGSCLVEAKGNLVFKRETFVRNYLSKNSKLGRMLEFVAVYNELKPKLGADVRQFVRGHDFAELLSIIIRRHLHHDQRNFRDPNVLEGTLFSCLEARTIQDEPLLKTVVSRMARSIEVSASR